MVERQVSSSEQTPLLGTANEDDSNNRIGFSRGLGIVVFMGLLVFIQSMIVASGPIDTSKGIQLTQSLHSDEYVNDDHSTVCHCS